MYKEILNMNVIKNIRKLNIEKSIVIYVKDNNYYSFPDTEYLGTKESVSIAPIKNIIDNCKKLNTNSIFIIHNHPKVSKKTGMKLIDMIKGKFIGGNPSPSDADIKITITYKQELLKKGINIIDHIILAENGEYSFKNFDLL